MKHFYTAKRITGSLLLAAILLTGGACQQGIPQKAVGADVSQTDISAPLDDSSASSAQEEELLSELFVPTVEKMHLADYAVKDSSHLILLYTSELPSNTPSFSLYETDLSDGSYREIRQVREMIITRSDRPPQLSIVDPQKAVVVDKNQGVFYFTDSHETFQPSLNVAFEAPSIITDCFMLRERMWCITVDGQLYEIYERNDEISGEHYRDALCCHTTHVTHRFDHVDRILDDGRILLCAASERQREPQTIYYACDPFMYKDENYTAERPTDEVICSVSSQGRVALKGTTLTFTEQDNRAYRFDFSESPLCSELLKNNVQGLHVSPNAVNGERLIFSITSQTGKVTLLSLNLKAVSTADVQTLSLTPYEIPDITKEDTAALEKAVEDEFGIVVNSHDEVSYETYGYHVEHTDDELYIYNVLKMLQKVYRNYPEGIFRQIHSSSGSMIVNLTGAITGTSEEFIKEASGLAGLGELCIVADIRTTPSVIYHETTHLLYRFIDENGGNHELYTDFMSLNPEGFIYSCEYSEYLEQTDEYTPLASDAKPPYDGVYFSTAYGKVNENEDIADLMGELMGNTTVPDYYESEHLQAKCRFFSGLLRKYFDTTGWDGRFSWEDRLDAVRFSA